MTHKNLRCELTLRYISVSVCELGYGKEGDNCVKCPDVKPYTNPETEMCEGCQPGYWYDFNYGNPICELCPIGKYRGTDDVGCQWCNSTLTETVGSTSVEDCCKYLMRSS